MTAYPSVAIVILNWNGQHYLQQFLHSVASTTYPNYRLIIADNCSTDHSISFLKQEFPEVEIIKLIKNFGFAKGYNEALKEVEADYYVLLNSDVEVTKNWLQPMINLLEEDAKYAACQPKILSYYQKHLFEYAGAAGGWLDNFGYPFARGRIFDDCEVDNGQYDDASEVFWASGAALVIKSEVYNKVGGFDDYFFAHQEEIDLCWRIQLQGYKIWCCPKSVVYHVGGGTLPKGNSRKTFLNFRNNHIMMAKNMSSSEKWWKVPFRLLLDQVSAFKGLLTGDGGYFLSIQKAHFAFFNWLIFKRKRGNYYLKHLDHLCGVYEGNVVWDYFVKKKKKFSQIFKKQV